MSKKQLSCLKVLEPGKGAVARVALVRFVVVQPGAEVVEVVEEEVSLGLEGLDADLAKERSHFLPVSRLQMDGHRSRPHLLAAEPAGHQWPQGLQGRQGLHHSLLGSGEFLGFGTWTEVSVS